VAGDDRSASEVRRLLDWFGDNARSLPWRQEPRDPYLVLVSELMLQQTQVERVSPRFARFVEAFPDFEALAAASEDEVLAIWSGLGYYRRARMLHRLARLVTAGSGELPTTAAGLRELPGVGPYTAAAVASLAFGEPVPVLDGNVLRVASRVLAFAGDPRSARGREALLSWLNPLVETGPPGRINEALMELGATVCRPIAPECDRCPLAAGCEALAAGRPADFPPPRARREAVELTWAAACCVDTRGRWLLRQVTEGPILVGLWLPPLASLETGETPEEAAQRLVPGPLVHKPERLAALRHSITHRRITVVPVRLWLAEASIESAAGRWVDPRTDAIATSSLFAKIRRVSDLPPEPGSE
jgi:A/G-specific adenine glycosylase